MQRKMATTGAQSSTSKWCARASFQYGVRIEQGSESAVSCTTCDDEVTETVAPEFSSLSALQEVTFDDVIPRVLNVIREKFVEESKKCSINELMGKKWQGMVVAWSHVLYAVCEQMPEYVAANQSKEGDQVRPLLDQIVGCLMGQAIDMVRLTAFLEKKGMIIEVEQEKIEETEPAVGTLHEKLRGGMNNGEAYVAYRCMDEYNDWIINKRVKKNETERIEFEDEGLDPTHRGKPCDQQMHGNENAEDRGAKHEVISESQDCSLLGNGLQMVNIPRGGAKNYSHIGDGWFEVKKKGGKQQKKSYYQNVKCNIAAVDISMGSSDSRSTEE